MEHANEQQNHFQYRFPEGNKPFRISLVIILALFGIAFFSFLSSIIRRNDVETMDN